MEDIEGLSEALKGLQVALDKVRELMPSDAAEDEAASIDESTADVAAEEGDDSVTKSSVTDDEDADLSKLSAIAAIQKHLG